MANEMILLTNLRTHPRGVHDSSRTYEPMDLVSSPDGTAAYIAVGYVPVGTQLTNTAYWQPHTDISDVGRAARQVTADMQAAAAAIAQTAAEGAGVVAGYADQLSLRVRGETAQASFGAPFTPDALSILRPVTQFSFTQQGEGDPAPDNIRPIEGRDVLRLTLGGKNLLPGFQDTTKNGISFTLLPDGGIHIKGSDTTGSMFLASTLIDRTLSGTFTLSIGNAQPLGDHLQLRLLETDSAQIGAATTNVSATTANASRSFTLDNQYVYAWSIRVGTGVEYDTVIYPMLERGGTRTQFAPTLSRDYTAALGQTVYGGEYDWFSGVLTQTWAHIPAYAGEALPGEWRSDRDAYSEGALPSPGAQVVYRLASPVQIQLAPILVSAAEPEQESTLTGDGETTVKYVKSLRASIEERVAAAVQAALGAAG